MSDIPEGKLNSGDELLISWARGRNDVFILAGKQLKNITQNTGYDYYGGHWFPDGQRILIDTNYNYTRDAYIVATDGTILQNLADGESYGFGHISPDGQFIFCTEYKSRNPSNVSTYLQRLKDNSRIKLNNNPGYPVMWSADSQSFKVIKRDNDQTQLEQYGLDGTLIKTTQTPYLNKADYISIAPDGLKVAYTLIDNDSDAFPMLYIANIDGTNTIKIGIHNIYETSPIWSPDSEKLAYVGMPNNAAHVRLYIVDANGKNKRDVMILDEYDEYGEIYPGTPAWSSDSQQIAMKSNLVLDEDDEATWGNDAVFVMNADGSNLRQVTESSGAILSIDWRPKP